MGREEYGEGKELLMILSIPPHQWIMVVVVSWRGHVWLPVELVLLYLLMMWLLTKAAGWILKCFGQYYLLIFSQMLQNSLDGASQCRWTMTQSILQKQPKSFEGKEVDCYAMAKSITWPESDWACISLAEGKMPQEQAGTEDGCSRGLAEHHQGWNPASGDVYAFQTSGCNWLQRICNQVLKSEVWFMIIILSHYFWSLNKWEAHMQTVVIPTPFTWFGCKYPQIKADSLQLKHILFVSFEIHCGGV